MAEVKQLLLEKLLLGVMETTVEQATHLAQFLNALPVEEEEQAL